MKPLEIETSNLDAEEKAIVKIAKEEYARGDFQNAGNHLLSIYKHDNNPSGLQVGIGACLVKLNKRRQARLFAFKELLDYPDNRVAMQLLGKENTRVNGIIKQHVFTNTERPEKYPDISLVLIVKNEEKDLPRCLDSFKDIVKEIIIVDTGSTDRTVEIAKSYGARVEYFEWCDDFAAARNESLKYASCEWILRTDADEYIEESEKIKLLHCANSGLADAYICPTISIVEKGEDVVENVRLIKNHLGITYEYPIHETIAMSMNRKGLTQCLVNINFKHTGYMSTEPDMMVNKIKRNIEVCNKYLVIHPDDYYVRLIRDLLSMDEPNKEALLDDMENVIQNLPEDTISVRYLGLAYLNLIKRYLQQKKDIELLNILNEIQIHFQTTNSIMQYAGEIYLYVRGDWKKANKLFSWNTKRQGESKVFCDVLPQKKYNHKENLLNLADTFVLSKDNEKAQKYYSLAKKIDLSNIVSDGMDQVKELQEKMDHLNESDLRVFAKTLREKSDWLNAYKAIIRAGSKSQLSFQDYLDMANCQIQLNNTKFAEILIKEAEKIDPEPLTLKVMESMIAIKDGNLEKALEKSVEVFVMEPGNPVYQKNVETIARLLKLSPLDAIRKTGLEWIKIGKKQIGLFALTIYVKFNPDDQEIKTLLNSLS